MPIFAYRCDRCGLEQDVLQKRSDPPLTRCPSCGEAAFSKKLTAPAFQLKGSGWYVTDFRDKGKKSGDGAGAASSTPSAPEPAKAEAPAAAASPAPSASSAD